MINSASAGALPVRRRSVTVALWAAQVLLAVQIGSGGVLKLVGDATMVDLFTDIGAGQWLRYVVGVIEVTGAAGLLTPRLSALAALGVSALLAGATITNVLLGVPPWIPLVLLLLSAAITFFRRGEIGGKR